MKKIKWVFDDKFKYENNKSLHSKNIYIDVNDCLTLISYSNTYFGVYILPKGKIWVSDEILNEISYK